jgi:hypothetical protein
VDHSDTDRLELLDRIADRVPELDLDQNEVARMTLDDGHEALLVNGGGVDGRNGAFFVNGGGVDGRNGAFFVNGGDDLHAVGSMAPMIDGWIGAIMIASDGSRRLAHAEPDPLAGRKTSR